MLSRLEVSNYALIQEASIDLHQGLTAITGETGSGKSIMLGALNLVLGERADLKLIGNPDAKCVIEATFKLDESFTSWFEQENLDFDSETHLRREITPSGKSRAFVNDTPVNLNVLRDIGSQLVEIHSQSQNSVLGKKDFQFSVVDAFAGSQNEARTFAQTFMIMKELEKELATLRDEELNAASDNDYRQFLLDELQAANLENLDKGQLEENSAALDRAEELATKLGQSLKAINSEGAALEELQEAARLLESIKDVSQRYAELSDRLTSSAIELADIASELENLSETVDIDPELAADAQQKLDTIYQLERKHRVEGVEALIRFRDEIAEKQQSALGYGDRIEELESRLNETSQEAHQQAENLRQKRLICIPDIEAQIKTRLSELSLPHATFKIQLSKRNELGMSGVDDVQFLFQANPGAPLYDIEKVASGGEVSRVMLAIKAALSTQLRLPTLILDEIDSGVSGEVAQQVGKLIKDISSDIQLISITHLPQIAGKAHDHLKVSKSVEGEKTITQVRRLRDEDRVEELAEMIAGKDKSEAALQNARELLA